MFFINYTVLFQWQQYVLTNTISEKFSQNYSLIKFFSRSNTPGKFARKLQINMIKMQPFEAISAVD